MNIISLNIKKIRKEKLLSQADFCQIIKVSRDVLAKIETGKSIPTTETITNIVRELHIDANWLLTGEGSMLKEEKTDSIGIKIKQEHNGNGHNVVNGNAELKHELEKCKIENENLKRENEGLKEDKAKLFDLLKGK